MKWIPISTDDAISLLPQSVLAGLEEHDGTDVITSLNFTYNNVKYRIKSSFTPGILQCEKWVTETVTRWRIKGWISPLEYVTEREANGAMASIIRFFQVTGLPAPTLSVEAFEKEI